MKILKKGALPKKKENTQTQLHIITPDVICLALLYGGLVLFVYGYTKGNGALWGFGIGLSTAMIILQAIVDREDNNNDRD